MLVSNSELLSQNAASQISCTACRCEGCLQQQPGHCHPSHQLHALQVRSRCFEKVQGQILHNSQPCLKNSWNACPVDPEPRCRKTGIECLSNPYMLSPWSFRSSRRIVMVEDTLLFERHGTRARCVLLRKKKNVRVRAANSRHSPSPPR